MSQFVRHAIRQRIQASTVHQLNRIEWDRNEQARTQSSHTVQPARSHEHFLLLNIKLVLLKHGIMIIAYIIMIALFVVLFKYSTSTSSFFIPTRNF